MGKTFQAQRLSDAAGRRAVGGLAARFDLRRFLSDQTGATAVEYGIMVGVLSLALVAVFGTAQALLLQVITDAASKVEAAIN